MDTTGLPELWHDALAFLSHQGTFAQIMIVTLAALFVVMALEGFRSSIRSIWLAHRSPSPMPNQPVRLAAPAPGAPRMRSFSAKAHPVGSSRPKVQDRPPRLFRSPRPTIKRVTSPALAGEDGRREAQSGEGATQIAAFPLAGER